MKRRDFSLGVLATAAAAVLPATVNAAPDPRTEPVGRPLVPPPPAGPLHLKVGDYLDRYTKRLTCDGVELEYCTEVQESSAPGMRDGWALTIVLDPKDVRPGDMLRDDHLPLRRHVGDVRIEWET